MRRQLGAEDVRIAGSTESASASQAVQGLGDTAQCEVHFAVLVHFASGHSRRALNCGMFARGINVSVKDDDINIVHAMNSLYT